MIQFWEKDQDQIKTLNLVNRQILILENNWRRRIYDALNVLQNSGAVEMDEKLIKLPESKKNICGLLVTREELYKDLVNFFYIIY